MAEGGINEVQKLGDWCSRPETMEDMPELSEVYLTSIMEAIPEVPEEGFSLVMEDLPQDPKEDCILLEEKLDSNIHIPVSLEALMNKNACLTDEINALSEKKKRAENDMKQWKQEYRTTKNQRDVLKGHNNTLRVELMKAKDELKHIKHTYSEEMSILTVEKEKAETAYNQAYRENLLIKPYAIQLKVQLEIYKDKLKEYDCCDLDYRLPFIESEYQDGYQNLRRATSEPWIEFPPMELSPNNDLCTWSCMNMSPMSESNSYSPLNSPFRRWYRYQGHDLENTPPLRSIHQEICDLELNYDSLALPEELAIMTDMLKLDTYDEELESDQSYMLHILCRIVENLVDSEYHISENEYVTYPFDIVTDEPDHNKFQKNSQWLQWAQVFLMQDKEKLKVCEPELVVYGEKKIFTVPKQLHKMASSFEVVKLGGHAKAYYPQIELLSQQASGDSSRTETCTNKKRYSRRPNWLLKKLKIRKVLPRF